MTPSPLNSSAGCVLLKTWHLNIIKIRWSKKKHGYIFNEDVFFTVSVF